MCIDRQLRKSEEKIFMELVFRKYVHLGGQGSVEIKVATQETVSLEEIR